MSGKGALITATEELVMEKPLTGALIPAKQVETSNMKTQNTINKASRTHSPSRHSSPIVNSGNGIPIDANEFTNRSCWALCISLFCNFHC